MKTNARICGAGENALIVYLGDDTSPEVSARVQAATAACEAALGQHLIDLVPAGASLLVIFDCLQISHQAVRDSLHQCLADLDGAESKNGKLVRLPAWYGPEAGPDIEELATRAELSVQEVIDIHQSTEYRVHAIGFAPGFAYLGQVDPRIAAPRLSTPRQRVPRGAIAIADRQTAVYPAPSPGGWNLIGLCPHRMFDPGNTPHMPVAVGDRVRFESISRERYVELGGES